MSGSCDAGGGAQAGFPREGAGRRAGPEVGGSLRPLPAQLPSPAPGSSLMSDKPVSWTRYLTNCAGTCLISCHLRAFRSSEDYVWKVLKLTASQLPAHMQGQGMEYSSAFWSKLFTILYCLTQKIRMRGSQSFDDVPAVLCYRPILQN
nr:uncharacterized protein LOC108177293 isoform X3 [Oryctolagus cuniculus]